MAHQIDIDILETAISDEAAIAASLQSFLGTQKSIFAAKLIALGQESVAAIEFADQYVETVAAGLLESGAEAHKQYHVKKGWDGAPRALATEVKLGFLEQAVPQLLDEGLERIILGKKAKAIRKKEML